MTTLSQTLPQQNQKSPQSSQSTVQSFAKQHDQLHPSATQQQEQQQQQQPAKNTKLLELEKLIREFQNKLGSNWDKYHESLSLFLIGKLSRTELVKAITPILKNGLIKYHNRLLLLNFANSLKDGPLDLQNEFASFWNKKAVKPKSVKSTQYEKFKQNIMGLPIRERRRIRSITKDSGKKGKLSASITLTRHSLLPKIPTIQDREQQQSQVNNLVQWQQDVVNGINSLICTENFELPDHDNLSRRVLMTMREYGLTGGLSPRVLEVISLGLEAHLSNIFETAMDVAKFRASKYATNDFLSTASSIINEEKKKSKSKTSSSDETETNPFTGSDHEMNGDYEDENEALEGTLQQPSPKRRKPNNSVTKRDTTLHIEDLYDTLEMFPHLIEPCGPKFRLSNVMLQNDDSIMGNNGLSYELPPKIEPLVELGIPSSSSAVNSSMAHPSNVSNGVLKRPDSADKDENGIKKETETANSNNNDKPETATVSINRPSVPSQVSGPDTSHIGTNDELKWVLHDLISTI